MCVLNDIEIITKHNDSSDGEINYVIWSDVFDCNSCGKEIVFWESAVNQREGIVLEGIDCPHCGVSNTKDNSTNSFITKYDNVI